MTLRFRTSLFLTSVATAMSALLVLAGAVWWTGAFPGASWFLALAASVPLALVAARLAAAPFARRLQQISAVATRHAERDFTGPVGDYGDDELGDAARMLAVPVQALGRRIDELTRDRRLAQAVLAGMVEGVLVVNHDGRLGLVNRAAQAMLKVDTSAVGRPYLEVIRHPAITAQLAAALRGDEPDSSELPLPRDPSRRVLARTTPVPASSGGGAVLVLHDISELRRADQIRRDFVANVSHELRTPLTAIRGYVEALLEEPSTGETSRRFLDIVARQTRRMDGLVRDLLRLARLDARQEPLDIRPCDLRSIFSATVTDLAPVIGQKRQRVTVDVGAEATTVPADPGKLQDIVRNLVENAVHYTPEETEIRVASWRDSTVIGIEVLDGGPGIPPEDIDRVFERFYRVDKSRSRPGGTGLGLAIVKHLVGLHGGQVHVQNRPGGGSRFVLTLPAERPAATTAAQATPAGTAGRAETPPGTTRPGS